MLTQKQGRKLTMYLDAIWDVVHVPERESVFSEEYPEGDRRKWTLTADDHARLLDWIGEAQSLIDILTEEADPTTVQLLSEVKDLGLTLERIMDRRVDP